MIIDVTERPLTRIEPIRSQAHALELLKTTEYADDKAMENILLTNVLRDSESWVCIADGEVGAFWGVTPKSILADEAYFWVLTTKIAKKWPFVFIRGSQLVVDELLNHYTRLVGLCEDENAMRWLRRFGATFGEKVMGKVAFEIRRK